MVSNLLPDCSDILATHLYRKQALNIHFKQMGINVYNTAHIQDPNQMKRRVGATPPMGPSTITNCESLATSWCSLMACSAGVKPWVQIVHTLANNWKTFSFPL
jgi:hypothetical protein